MEDTPNLEDMERKSAVSVLKWKGWRGRVLRLKKPILLAKMKKPGIPVLLSSVAI
jgi:hypothetical protein